MVTRQRIAATVPVWTVALACLLVFATAPIAQEPGEVLSWQQISNASPSFPDRLQDDQYGQALAVVGPLAAGAPITIAAGASQAAGTEDYCGAVWLSTLQTDGSVSAPLELTEGQAGFSGDLDMGDNFGAALACPGDLDGDGVDDLLVGAPWDDDGGTEFAGRGALWVLFLNADHTVKAHRKVSDTAGGFGGGLLDFDEFGRSVAILGDLDGDGLDEWAVGAPGDEDGAPFSNRGAVWVIYPHANGTVKAWQKISSTQGGFTGTLGDQDQFGWSVAGLGDLDGDGVPDLAVGAIGDPSGGTFNFNVGAAWILFLNGNGTVKGHQKINETNGGFGGVLDDFHSFGSSLAAIGDLDGDLVVDLAVGARNDPDGATFPGELGPGAIWVLFLQTDGTVKTEQKISNLHGGLGDVLGDTDQFGSAAVALGDLQGDGILDLGVGAPSDTQGGYGHGSSWSLFLNADGTVLSKAKVGDLGGGMQGTLDPWDEFGSALASLGDLDGNGVHDLAVGSPGDDEDWWTSDAGAVWVLFLDADDDVDHYRRIGAGDFGGGFEFSDRLGSAVVSLGDVGGGGGGIDLAIGAPGDDDFSNDAGAVYIARVGPDGTLLGHEKISATSGGFGGVLDTADGFGSALTQIDLDGDGVPELVVGAPGDDDSDIDCGAVWILTLDASFDVVQEQKISALAGGFTGTLDFQDSFGSSVAALRDLDGDGIDELAVGAPGDDDGGASEGAVWVLFMNADGTVKAHQKISQTEGGFTGTLGNFDAFGTAVASAGKLDGDARDELVVGAPGHDEGGPERGAAFVLFLESNGTVASHRRVAHGTGGFGGALEDGDAFGTALASLGDSDHDGTQTLAIGSPGDDDGGTLHGAVWTLEVHKQAWAVLGGGLAGLFGVTPMLEGSGSLEPLSTFELSLSFARPDSVATLVVGFNNLSAPFKGGTLVPSPDLLVGLFTNFAGDLLLLLPWPEGMPSELTLYYQYWIVDPVGAFGFSASNAVSATTP